MHFEMRAFQLLREFTCRDSVDRRCYPLRMSAWGQGNVPSNNFRRNRAVCLSPLIKIGLKNAVTLLRTEARAAMVLSKLDSKEKQSKQTNENHRLSLDPQHQKLALAFTEKFLPRAATGVCP